MIEVYEIGNRHAIAGRAETEALERPPQAAPQVEQPPPHRLGSPREPGRRGHIDRRSSRRPSAGGVTGLRTGRAARTEAAPSGFGSGVLQGLLGLALLAVRREETRVS